MKYNKNIFWGIAFICIAAIIIMGLMGVLDTQEVGIWRIGIGLLLCAAAINSLIYAEFFGIFIPLGFVAILFRPQLGLSAVSVWPILAAAFCLAIGFSILFHKGHARWRKRVADATDGEAFCSSAQTVKDDIVQCEVSFGASIKYIHAENLRSAKLEASFSSLKVYFDQATLDPGGAVVHVECAFSGVELYIPHAWKVVDHITTSLGATKSNRPHNQNGEPTLTLTGNASFGAIEIIYV